MYNYTPINPYRSKTIEDAKKIKKGEIENFAFINTTELDTVKTLFQIRNANYYNKSVRNDYNVSFLPKERVFIAGKIFPVINLIFKETVNSYDATKIELKNWKSNDPIYDSKIHNRQYVSIDNDNLIILLPISYLGINFPKLMLDFLTNQDEATNTKNNTIGGEFPDYQTYKLALRDKAIERKKWIGQDGSWLTIDRADNNGRWRRAYSYIIKHKIKGRLAPFAQIHKFYDSVDWYITNVYKHEVKWCKGAKRLVEALSKSSLLWDIGSLEGGSNVIDNDVETILNELNLGICDYAIEKFHELIYGKYAKTPLKGDAAYNWDVAFITYEQGTVAPPIYKKTSIETIRKFQKMADKDGFDENNGPSSLGAGALFLNKITPAFDDFTPPAQVTDDQFRIDLPLLMLYLDKHRINKNKVSPSLKNYLISNNNPDGLCLVNNKCKDIIKEFVV